jgi:hypothetical protein
MIVFFSIIYMFSISSVLYFKMAWQLHADPAGKGELHVETGQRKVTTVFVISHLNFFSLFPGRKPIELCLYQKT